MTYLMVFNGFWIMQELVVFFSIAVSALYLLRCFYASFQSCEIKGCGACPVDQKLLNRLKKNAR